MKKHSFILLVFAHIAANSSAEIIPQNRRIPWNAGVEGGIPAVTRVFTTLPATATLADVNAAIASCPSNQVVQLSAGIYNFTGQILFSGRRGVVLRGAGPDRTILRFSGGPQANIYLVSANVGSVSSPSQVRNWTSGYAQNSTNITVDSTSGMSVGMMLALDQLNDDLHVTARSGTGGSCSYCSRSSGTRIQCQYVKVVAINGNNVTISPGLHMPNWTAAQSPQAWWAWGGTTEMCGIEDMTVDHTSSSEDFGIEMFGTWNCWVKNIKSIKSNQAHVRTFCTGRTEARHSYFFGTKNSASQSYGVLFYYSSDGLMEDNIANEVVGACEIGSQASGCVAIYNYCTNTLYAVYPSWMIGTIAIHAGHNCMNLIEGNHANAVYMDLIHGSGSHNTVFRNRLIGWEPGKSGNTFAIAMQATNHFHNVVGNILGKAGFHSRYENNGGTYPPGGTIFCLGFLDVDSPYWDPAVLSTLIRHGNYDVVNNSVIWDPSIADRALRPSYYYSSKPSWFGDRPWPPFDPANPNGAAITNLPAGFRFVFGFDPPGSGANQPPSAIANATPKLGLPPLPVTFSSAGSFDPEGTTLTYNWVFGDGATSTAANPVHTYSTAGSYVARLTVSDGTNTATSLDITIGVGNQSPIVAATANPLLGAPPLTVNFSSTGSSDPEGLVLTYNWDFGDGSTSTAANPSHTYVSLGTYKARLTVSDGNTSVTSSDLNIVVNRGLVAAFGFEEASGTAAVDSSGNNINGTLVNNPTRTVSGKFGKALEFNGTSSYVNVPDAPALDVTTAVTLMAWCYPTNLNNTYRNIVWKEQDIYFLEGCTPSNLPRFSGTYASGNLDATGPMPLNQWTHLAGTYDGATMRLYINGVQVSSRAQAGPIVTSTGALGIGGNSLNGQYWPGRIDEVRIYNRALSASEIQADMNTPVSGGPARPATPEDFRFDTTSSN